METKRQYRGRAIYECEWVKGEHSGRWIVQTYHQPTGLPWSDANCPHFSTLAQAKAWIRFRDQYDNAS